MATVWTPGTGIATSWANSAAIPTTWTPSGQNVPPNWTNAAFASWSFATTKNVTLSNNDLTATSGANFRSNSGVMAVAPQTSGKYYLEITVNTGDNLGGIGVCLSSAGYDKLNADGTGGVIAYAAGQVWSQGSRMTVNGFDASVDWNVGSGTVIGIAVDVGNSVWFKVMPFLGGNSYDKTLYWNDTANNSANANNAPDGSGGIAVPSGSIVPFVNFAGSNGAQFTANFGLTPFAIGNDVPLLYELWPS